MPDPVPEFELGLVLAGGASGGAYSAGAMDFIIEALDAYEAAKAEPGWDGPTHRVRMPVMTGASAGGMTAAISALHAFHGLEHVWPGRPIPPPQANRLYSSWVSDISIEALLATADLSGGREAAGVKSALCSDVLDAILDRAFQLQGTPRVPAWVGRRDDLTLRVMLTVTNLRGVPYSFKLLGTNGASRYGMLNHGDYVDFALGLPAAPSPDILDVRNTGAAAWTLFKDVALATGAFPIGLVPRALEREPSVYRTAERVGFERPPAGFTTIPPDDSIDQATPYRFIAVDGGAIDNEPLELARRALAGGDGAHNTRAGAEADRAVVLIAPFPNLARLPADDAHTGLASIVPRLAAALLEQARFKPDELALAENPTIFSRFMISPARTDHGNPAAVRYPIASGTFGGFGGFLHESFRRHDYLLGRRNAQAFLRWVFALPETNHLFDAFRENRTAWYVHDTSGASGTVGAEADGDHPLKRFAETVDGPRTTHGLPIIPLAPRLRQPIVIAPEDLPAPNLIDRDALHERIRARAGKVVDTLVDVDFLSQTKMFLGSLVRFGVRRYGTQLATQKVWGHVESAIDDVRAAFPQ
jgi:hypothetical protein